MKVQIPQWKECRPYCREQRKQEESGLHPK